MATKITDTTALRTIARRGGNLWHAGHYCQVVTWMPAWQTADDLDHVCLSHCDGGQWWTYLSHCYADAEEVGRRTFVSPLVEVTSW